MVQVSTTLFVAALAVAPALAAPLTLAEEFESRDVQDLEVRGRISKAIGRFFGSAGSSAVEAQVNGARSFDDYLEVRGGKGGNKKQQPQRQQPQRQSSGVSSSLGRFVGGVGSGIVENQTNSGRSFIEDDDVLEVRGGKKDRKNRNRKNRNKQAETQTTSTEQSSTTENGARDFIDLQDYLEVRGGKGGNKKQQPQRQQPQRQSSGVSSSLGRFVGGVGSGIIENQMNSGRSFVEDDNVLEVRGGKGGNKKQQPQRQQPQRQSSGVSSSLGRFVGGVGSGIVENQMNSGRSFSDEELLLALRDFIDFDDLVYEAREIDELE